MREMIVWIVGSIITALIMGYWFGKIKDDTYED
jgi:uncharacterized membrane protein YraQ (UPF0718 family)